jgi:hypothetical protein
MKVRFEVLLNQRLNPRQGDALRSNPLNLSLVPKRGHDGR